MKQWALLRRPCPNGHVLQGGIPLNSVSTQKTLKHIPLTHTSSLNPRLVFNYTLFYFIVMSNKLSTLISTSILYYLNLMLLSCSPCYSSWSHPGILLLLHPRSHYQRILAVLPFKDLQNPSTSHYLHRKHPGWEPALFLTCFLISYSTVCSHLAARVTWQSLSQIIYFFP